MRPNSKNIRMIWLTTQQTKLPNERLTGDEWAMNEWRMSNEWRTGEQWVTDGKQDETACPHYLRIQHSDALEAPVPLPRTCSQLRPSLHSPAVTSTPPLLLANSYPPPARSNPFTWQYGRLPTREASDSTVIQHSLDRARPVDALSSLAS